MKQFTATRRYFTLALLMLTALSFHLTTKAQDDNTILGAGSTFVYPLFSKQFSEYNKKTGIQVNYQSIGSGGGILQLTNKTVDFGDSNAPLNDEQTTKMGAPVIHIPMCSGAVVITYNLPGLNANLNFTPDVIADIYLGRSQVGTMQGSNRSTKESISPQCQY
jgi:phosphate transport system substrate-binding protein